METKKIAVACFIGGVLCCVVCAVAFMFAPALWWLGVIAGFAGGYISYDFREFFKTRPIHYSEERFSCACYGTFSGILSFAYLTSTSMSFAAHIVSAVFGGLIGVIFGVILVIVQRDKVY